MMTLDMRGYGDETPCRRLSQCGVASRQRGRVRGYRHVGHYHPSRYYPHHRHDGFRGGYLVGGLLLGSLLTHALYSAPPREVIYVDREPYIPPRVVYRESTVRVVPSGGRQLLRDLDGRCYQRTFDANGDELRTELPASRCDW